MVKRFIECQTLWGNNYRKRYYLDGKRVPQWQFDVAFNVMAKSGESYTRKTESIGSTKYRTTWQKESGNA